MKGRREDEGKAREVKETMAAKRVIKEIDEKGERKEIKRKKIKNKKRRR